MKKYEKHARLSIIIALVLYLVTMTPAFVGAEKKIIIKHALQNLAPADTHTQTAKKYSELVNERSGGRIEIRLFPGTIADGPELLTVAQEGVADSMSVVTAFIGSRVRSLAPIDYLGAYPAEKKFLEVADAIKPVMTKILDKEDLTYLGCAYSFSGWIFASTKKHFLTLADLKGQKLRIPGMWLNKQHKAFGVSPVMILPAELYPSLQRGVIDGLGTIGSLIVGFKLYEPAPFITEMMETSCSLVIFAANTRKFLQLSVDDQDLLKKAAYDAEKWSYDYGRKIENEMRALLKTKANYAALSDVQKKDILDARGDLKAELLDYAGPLGLELMNVFDSIK